jgi:hypothetical protein
MLIRVVKAVGNIIANIGIWYTFTRFTEELVCRAVTTSGSSFIRSIRTFRNSIAK